MRWTQVAAVIAVLCGASSAPAKAPLETPSVHAPIAAEAPSVDGHVRADEWRMAPRMRGFAHIGPRAGTLFPGLADFYVTSDGRTLFVAVVSELPPSGELVARVPPAPLNGNARTWMDDSIEVVIDPTPDAPSDERWLYHANLNARGAVHDNRYRAGGKAESWRGRWQTASETREGFWHFELAIPLADLGITRLDDGHAMGLRIGRNWVKAARQGILQTEWGNGGQRYLHAPSMPRVTWDRGAPVVQTTQLLSDDREEVRMRVHLLNPTDRPLALHAVVGYDAANSAPAWTRKPLTLEPGGSAWVETRGYPGGARETLTGRVRVVDTDRDAVVYHREFRFTRRAVETVWPGDLGLAAQRTDLKFAYYPSHDRARVRVDLSPLGQSQREQVDAVVAVILDQASGEEISRHDVPFMGEHVADAAWALSALDEGDYVCRIELQGLDHEPLEQAFVRRVMPWEDNDLGRSDPVLPPFEPLTVVPRDDGHTLTAVGRSHTLARTGLWQQVVSLDRPLLTGPMRLEAVIDGRSHAAAGSLTVEDQAATRVTTASRIALGPLQATTTTQWDLDGAMWWTLHLPAASTPIEKLQLTIPVDNAEAPLMHACTDGIRFNYAGSVPEGDGTVWTSQQAPRRSILGSYVPYLWVGGPERGIALFGENDRGWVVENQTPTHELIRDGEQLLIRLHLIARTAELDRPRTLRVGFQATPTKPMPDGWRTWNTSWAATHPAVTRDIRLLGSYWYQGTLTRNRDLYPRRHDLSIWDEFTRVRRTGQINSDWATRWLAGYPEEFQLGGNASIEDRHARHIRMALQVLSGQPQRVVTYTNPRGTRLDTPEGLTFADEWDRNAFVKRDWDIGGGIVYDVHPVESFRDYAMWYYARRLETFVDDIYWDNIFMQSAFDVVGTEAYVREDGHVQPASGLTDMRALIRRTAVLGHEMNVRPSNWVHMSNTAIAPILSFAHLNFTWEDHAGDAPFQERFSRDYILAESIGRQHGNAPFALLLIGGPDEQRNAAAARSAAGVMLTHEIKTHETRSRDWTRNIKRLWDFGYGHDPATRVHLDWQADAPFVVDGPETSTLLVSKPGAAIAVVCDWSGGGATRLTIDADALGLSPPLTATDAETAQPLRTDGFSVDFTLGRYDFRVIALESGTRHAP